MSKELMLAADIGGTKSELALFSLAEAELRPVAQMRLANRGKGGLAEVVAEYLASVDSRPTAFCVDVAGVVQGRQAKLTNLPWTIDLDSLDASFGFTRSLMINDMTALCNALPVLGPEDYLVLQEGHPKGKNLGILAPGTGLGQGMVIDAGDRLVARGCEGGHCDFAPIGARQLALASWMQQKGPQVSGESLMAGPGIANLYDFFKDLGELPETEAVAAELTRAVDRTPIILAGFLADPPCPLCQQVIEFYLELLGQEAANLALKLFADGGIYLGGGVLPRLAGKVSFRGFLAAFTANPAMQQFLVDLPVRLITHASAPLLGVANYGRSRLAFVCPSSPR